MSFYKPLLPKQIEFPSPACEHCYTNTCEVCNTTESESGWWTPDEHSQHKLNIASGEDACLT